MGSQADGHDAAENHGEASSSFIAAVLREQLFDRFESDWQSSSPPHIETYLEQIPVADRDDVLRELLAIELDVRLRRGETPQFTDYCDRFPDREEVVESAYRDAMHAAEGRHPPKLARFRSIDLLGVGGQGEVWLMLDPDIDRRVAVKIVQPSQRGSQATLASFRREAELSGQLEHPNIVPVYDITTENDASGRPDSRSPCYVMRVFGDPRLHAAIEAFHRRPRSVEDQQMLAALRAFEKEPSPAHRRELEDRLLNFPFSPMLPCDHSLQESIRAILATDSEAGTLTKAITRLHSGVWSEAALRKLLNRFQRVCEGVAYAHSRGVIHRDLKPDNIMLGEYGETLVADWGLAKAVGRDELAKDIGSSQVPGGNMTQQSTNADAPRPVVTSEALDSLHTRPGELKGTPAFMSPEQAEGRIDELAAATDIYSLGAILYRILTGRSPFPGTSVEEVLSRVRIGKFSRPREVNPHAPKSLEAIVLKAMMLKPSDRYATALDLAADVEHWLNDEPVSACRDPWYTRLQRRSRKHPRTVTAIAATVLVATIALAISSFVLKQERDRLELALQVGFKLLRGIERESAWSIDDAYSDILQNGLRLPDNERAAMFPLYLALTDLQSADELRQSAGRPGTNDAVALLNRAAARMQLGNALSNLNTAIEHHEESGLAWLLKAQIRREILNEPPGDVLPDWNRAVELLPKSSAAFSGRGWCWLALKKQEPAQSDLNRAAQIDPRNEFAQLGLGRLAEGRGDHESAARHFRAAAELPMRYNTNRVWQLGARVEASYALWAHGKERFEDHDIERAFDEMLLAVQFAQPRDCPAIWDNLLLIVQALPSDSALKSREDLRFAPSRFRNRPAFDFARDVLIAVLDVRSNQPAPASWVKLSERRAGEPSQSAELNAQFESHLREWITSEDVTDPIRKAVTDFLNGARSE